MKNTSNDLAVPKPEWEQVAEQIRDLRNRSYFWLLLTAIAILALSWFLTKAIGLGDVPNALVALVAAGFAVVPITFCIVIWLPFRPFHPDDVVTEKWITKQSDLVKAWLAALVPENVDGLLRFADIDKVTQQEYVKYFQRNISEINAIAFAKQRESLGDHSSNEG